MFMNMYGVTSMEKMNKRNFEKDYLKAVKKLMREEVGLTPTRIQKTKKAYNRQQNKKIDDTDIE